MKLIVTGATGYIGTEVIRQALHDPAVTSVIALARNSVSIPEQTDPHINPTKLKWVQLTEWEGKYPDDVVEQLKGADACIWCLTIVPSKSEAIEFLEVPRITIEWDQTKNLDWLPDYRLMRGRCETELIQFAERKIPDIAVAAARPGYIDGPGREVLLSPVMRQLQVQYGPTHEVHISEFAASLVYLCKNGIHRDIVTTSESRETG